MAPQIKEQPAFREVNHRSVHGKTQLVISEHGGNQAESMSLLKRNGMRPLTYQEALAHAPELMSELQGKWFFLDGKAAHEDGIYTYNADGELAKPIGTGKSDQRVRVWKGSQLSTLYVSPDSAINWRFDLRGDSPPDHVAPVVVGAKIDYEAHVPKNILSGAVAVSTPKFILGQAEVEKLVDSGAINPHHSALFEIFRE